MFMDHISPKTSKFIKNVTKKIVIKQDYGGLNSVCTFLARSNVHNVLRENITGTFVRQDNNCSKF